MQKIQCSVTVKVHILNKNIDQNHRLQIMYTSIDYEITIHIFNLEYSKHTKPCALAFYFFVVILIFGILFRTV